MMLRWRVFYGDGSTFGDEDGSPYDAPAFNVQVVMNEEPSHGRLILNNKDYYWWDHVNGTWFAGDMNGLWDYLALPGPRKVLYGRFIPYHDYHECMKAAMNAKDFPQKSAGHPAEHFRFDPRHLDD